MSGTATGYVVGIDVGSRSVGLAALAVDSRGVPTHILNSVVYTHDGGVDPNHNKSAETRKSVRGLARRVRRLIARRSKRERALDRYLTKLGWPLVDLSKESDSFLPWHARARLCGEFIEDPEERDRLLSIAVRHMIRHRGWRNPWTRVESLLEEQDPSDAYERFRSEAEKILGASIEGRPTPSQIVEQLGPIQGLKLRGDGSVIGGALQQTDNAHELMQICYRQQVSEQVLEQLIRRVFSAESPRGRAAELAGPDPLPGQSGKLRAPKCSLAFQNYRIVSVLMNLRVKEGSSERRLTPIELRDCLDFLSQVKGGDTPAWSDVADVLHVERHALKGTAKETADGERAYARPPVNRTEADMLSCKIKPVVAWWKQADGQQKEAFLVMISNAGGGVDDEAGASVADFLETLDDQVLVKLDGLQLAAGRAAYSTDSLERLTEYMLDNAADLYEARRAVFGVEPDWAPPADPIEQPVGNPAVDRVLKIVARWLARVEGEWGAPSAVTIEHVRAGFMSTKSAVQQNGQCLYCGDQITYFTAEMDHIVPRSGPGSTNTRSNLVAVCHRCNVSKSNIAFATWAGTCGIPGVSVAEAVERVKRWLKDPTRPKADNDALTKAVIERLKRADMDSEIDSRSIESVAWMANELRHRIQAHYGQNGADTKVGVFRGNLTAEARKASGIDKRIPFVGGSGKTRLDRRHHAVDAAVVALMRPSVGKTLAERSSIRRSEWAISAPETWKQYEGSDPAAIKVYRLWREQMDALADLLIDAVANDRIPVTQNIRLRLDNSSVHKETVTKLIRAKVGDAMPVDLIDRAATPALWCALTRHPDFDAQKGLPENPNRTIKLQGRALSAHEEVRFFESRSAWVQVRKGAALLGEAHHARVYRVRGKRTKYFLLQAYALDLRPFRGRDLFQVELPPQSISVRTAHQQLRDALKSGSAEYVGWLVAGDELKLDMSAADSGAIAQFVSVFPNTSRWRIAGFEGERIRLRPVILSAEGLDDDSLAEFAELPGVNEILVKRGWRVSITGLSTKMNPTVIRRDALGRPRLRSNAHLPTCWRVDD